MAQPLVRALTERGERVRVYMPFGELIPGMAYLVRRLLENTSNESFLRRGFADQESPEVLLADPDGGRSSVGAGPLVRNARPPAGPRRTPASTARSLPATFANEPRAAF